MKERIKAKALELGFQKAGVSALGPLPPEEIERFDRWIADNFHGTMRYMERYREIRRDPSLLLKGAKSIVCVAMNYYNGEKLVLGDGAMAVSRYAVGEDYHLVVGEKLRQLAAFIAESAGAAVKICVDTKPLAEKFWAERVGIGWRGKNGNVITRDYGSWIFLGEIVTDVELEPDKPSADHCGKCSRCIDACPTAAIVAPGVVDSRRCISYLTIEHKGEIDGELHRPMGNLIFGCDICQEVCPWNRFRQPTTEKRFLPSEENRALTVDTLLSMTPEGFDRTFAQSPIKRAGREGLSRNAAIAMRNGEGLIS